MDIIEEKLDSINAIKEKSIELASQLWCKPETEHIDMIPELACAARDEFIKLLTQIERANYIFKTSDVSLSSDELLIELLTNTAQTVDASIGLIKELSTTREQLEGISYYHDECKNTCEELRADLEQLEHNSDLAKLHEEDLKAELKAIKTELAKCQKDKDKLRDALREAVGYFMDNFEHEGHSHDKELADKYRAIADGLGWVSD